MTASLAIQYGIVALVILASVWITLRKLAPQRSNRWLAGASIRLRLHGRSGFSKWLGRRLQPRQATGDCADGCATCGACGPKIPVAARGPHVVAQRLPEQNPVRAYNYMRNTP